MNEAWLVVVLAGIGTYTMRTSFLVAASRMVDLPPWAERVLRQIPPAALASIVVPALLRPEGDLDLWQPHLAAGLLAGAVAFRTRNTALTLAVGLGVIVLLERL